MATSVVFPRAQFFANNGKPLIGGRIHSYVAGSSTRARTYKDAAKSQPNTNPITLDGRGEAAVYLDEGVEYKFLIEDSKGALIMTQEPVYGAVWPNAASWPSDPTLSYRYMSEAKAAAESIGVTHPPFDTYAQAVLALPELEEDDVIEVSRDETRDGARTRYRVAGATLEFVVNLDQLRVDLQADEFGSKLVTYKPTGATQAKSVQQGLDDLPVIDRFSSAGQAISHATTAGLPALATKSLTVRIPTDSPTIQAALQRIAPIGDVRITLVIEAGHRLTAGLMLGDGDWSRFRITSTDAVVFLDPSWIAGTPILWAQRAIAPVWEILVDCQGKNVAYGEGPAAFSLCEQSFGVVGAGKGVINGGGGAGLFAFNRSSVVGPQSVWTGFSGHNIWITHVSDARLERAVATGAGAAGAFISRLSRAYMCGIDLSGAAQEGVLARRSFVTIFSAGATSTKINNTGGNAVHALQGSTVIGDVRDGYPLLIDACKASAIVAATGSTVDVGGAIIVNPVGDGFAASGTSRITAVDAKATGCGARGARAGGNSGSGGEIDARGATLSSAGSAVQVLEGGTIFVTAANCTSIAGHGLEASQGGRIVGPSVKVTAALDAINASTGAVVSASLITGTGAGRYGIFAQAADVNITGGNISGAGVNGVVASRGARVNLSQANWRRGASDDVSDLLPSSGAMVTANGGTGGSSLAINTFSNAGFVTK